MTCKRVPFGGTAVPEGFPALIPCPQSVTAQPGRWVSLYSGTVVESDEVAGHGFLARQLADELAAATGGNWAAARGPWPGTVRLMVDRRRRGDRYTLDVAGDGTMTIAGGGDEGLRYGVQTARQLVRHSAGMLPVVHIEDEPAYTVRGYYMDVTRGRVPTAAGLRRLADDLALYKYNQLHLYIEHAFAFPALSEAWRGTDPLRPEEILAFDEYCFDRGIELVPSVSTFGHMYAILRTRGFRELGEFPEDADRPFGFIERQEHHTLNVTLDEAFALSRMLIDQYMPLFRSKRFNLGADETFDLGRGRSRDEAGQRGIGSMYVDYVNRLCDYVVSRGGEPMLWGDVALAHHGALERLDDHAILLNWQYDPKSDDAAVRRMAEAGARQYVCPAVHGWNTLLPPLRDAWDNIAALAGHGVRYHAEGFLLTDWGDYGHVNDPRLSAPGMMYGAECSWNAQHAGFDEMNRNAGDLMFGQHGEAVIAAWERLGERAAMSWGDAVCLLELDMGDGSLNLDVLQALSSSGMPYGPVIAQSTDVDEARRRFLASARERLARVPTSPQALPAMQSALRKAKAWPDREPLARMLMLACAGQDLLNECGWRLAVNFGVLQEQDGVPSAATVASALEHWFEEYRDQWRDQYRQSELDRIGSVVWRLCDLLRAC